MIDPMDIDDIDSMTTGEGGADLAYRWTIRALYAGLIALNVWVMWGQADPTSKTLLVAKVSKWKDDMLAPMRAEKLFRHKANHVIFEAMQTVEAEDHA